MNKKSLSIMLLCLITICFILTIMLCVDTGISAYELKNTEIDTMNDKLPGGSIIGMMVASFAIWGGFLFLEVFLATVGFVSSAINKKIAPNSAVKTISTVFLYLYSVILAICVGIMLYCVIYIAL